MTARQTEKSKQTKKTMSRDDVKPQAMMRYMEEDDTAVAPLSHSIRRVKIEENWTWNLRLLPVELGKDRMPYVRMARHWRNKAPIYCPQWTPIAYGGNPEEVCPVCELSERLLSSGSENVRDVGYSSSCKVARLFYCIVIDMQDPRGRIDELPIEEIINPYQFEMTKNTWDDFKKYQKLAATRQKNPSDLLLLDLETGCNFLATGTTKGIKLDRSDPSAILNEVIDINDPQWQKYIDRIWARIRQPVVTLPTEKQLFDFVAKCEEDAEGGSRRRGGRGRGDEDERGGRGRGRSRDEDRDGGRDDGFRRRREPEGEDNDRDFERGSRRRQEPEPEQQQQEQAAPPSRRQRAPEPEPETAQQEPEQQAPPPRRQPVPQQQQQEPESDQVAPPPRRQPQTPAPVTARRQQPQESEPQGQEEAAPAPPPPTRRGTPTAPPPARRQPAQEAANGDDGDLGPQTTPPPPRRQAVPEQQGADPEEDNVPEEKRDPAPATRERVEEPPPPVQAKAPSPRRGADPAELQERLARLNQRQK